MLVYLKIKKMEVYRREVHTELLNGTTNQSQTTSVQIETSEARLSTDSAQPRRGAAGVTPQVWAFPSHLLFLKCPVPSLWDSLNARFPGIFEGNTTRAG